MSKGHFYQDYQNLLYRIPWGIKRFGWPVLFMKPLRVIFTPLILRMLPPRTLEFRGESLDYFYHAYNITWATERCVEVPLAQYFLRRCKGRVLEVGNVLSHYFGPLHDVVDKFESGERVLNCDITEVRLPEKLDLILSISTFEHIGFDDDQAENSGQKIKQAIEVCKGLLAPSGLLVFTVPFGYNREMDQMIRSNEIAVDRAFFLKRVEKVRWEPCSKEEAMACRYASPFPYANALMLAEVDA